MPGTLRWGILGPGGIAETFANDLRADGFAIGAVGSRSLDRAQEFAEKFDVPTAHGSYEELVADPDVDIVYVATPHSAHYPHVRLALEAGKHVLVEKPFTVTAEQARILADLARDRGLVLLEAMWTRWLPHMVRIREIIAEGTLGDIRTVLADHHQNLPTDPEHRLQNPDLAGGALLDLGIYPVSFIHDVLGAPAQVHANAVMTPTGVDQQTSISFEFDGGRQALAHIALNTAGPNRASVVGTEGWIDIAATWYRATTFTVYDSDGVEIERYADEFPGGKGMQFEAAEIERLIESGQLESSVLPLSESVAIMEVLDEVRKQIGLDYPAAILAT